MPIGRLENTKVLQCQECGVEKVLVIDNTYLNDKLSLSAKIDELLKNKKYSLYNKNIKECNKCGSIIGDIFELSKTNSSLKCTNCSNDVSYLIDEVEKRKKGHKRVAITIFIFFILLILSMLILELFGFHFE
ncbi:MAG: hypothetical protein WC508_04145 [Patescibacteria group bacterium]